MLRHLLTFATVVSLGACQTVEEDYGFDKVAARCDNRINRPVVSTSANGSYHVQPVNTQKINCAGSARTFEIMGERSGG